MSANDPSGPGEHGDVGGFGFGIPIGGAESGDVPTDAPLFRELQRVLSASAGSPVNWELARQVGIAGAQGGEADLAPSDEDQRGVEEAVRLAELHVAQHTGLEPPADVATVRAVRRAAWVEANIESLRSVLEPSAERIGRAIAKAQAEAAPEGMEAMAAQLRQAMGAISPLLLGVQVGQVLGFLGRQVLGQYDIAVPRPGRAQLLFVSPNIAAFQRDWSLDPSEFLTWVALHEVTHRFEFSRPWAPERFRGLLEDFLTTLEVDLSGLQEKLGALDLSDPQAMQEAFGGEEGLFGTVLDDEQRIKLSRIQAFMSAAEGYGDHVMHAVGAKLLPSAPRIEEAMRRYRETEHVDPVFERLLGIEMKREQYRAGRTFCDAVVEATDEATLARMWDSPEALPSLPEIEEPRLWLARSV